MVTFKVSPEKYRNRNLALWVALLFATCASVTGTAVYIRKKYSVMNKTVIQTLILISP